ncbi:MAG: hypothetical protein RIA65_03980 [Woeseia sp.]
MVAALREVFPRDAGTNYFMADDENQAGAAGFGPVSIFEILARLVKLSTLPPNWDSYSAKSISSDSIAAASQTLADLIGSGVAVPHLVPTSAGFVQAEWRRDQKYLELEFVSPVEIQMYYEDEVTGEEVEEILDFDLSTLYRRTSEFLAL